MNVTGVEEPASREKITKHDLIDLVRTLKPHSDRPAFVVISGYGGSGKSTLALRIDSALSVMLIV
jgi:putative protein kinase ArgK-like GTPase of G3E family